ncbi:MAG: hypothetical protein OCC49_05855 [Fibrobacterales bacterium]
MKSVFEINTGYPAKKDISDVYDTVMVYEALPIETSVGTLVPIHYTEDFSRKKQTPVRMFEDGTVRSIPLMDTTVITTPIGEYSAELVTFYKNGALKKFFPLNGKIGAYWTEEDECGLAEPISIGGVTAKIISAHFFETGELQSIQFWPGEKASITTPIGAMEVQGGVSFYKNGLMYSCEPLLPSVVETPVGYIQAWDPKPNGMAADRHSLQFNSSGNVIGLKTDSAKITVTRKNGTELVLSPIAAPSACGPTGIDILPLELRFDDEGVIVKTPVTEACRFNYSDEFELSFFEYDSSLVSSSCGS